MVIEINKDVDKYKESIALGLTAKQMVFSIASVIVGGAIVLALYQYVGLTTSAYIAIPAVAPIALTGFYSFNGMSFMEVMRLRIHYMFGNRALTYVSTESEAVIRRLRIEEANADKKKKKSKVKSNGQETNRNDFKKAQGNLFKMLGAMILMIAGFVAFAIWYKYYR